jgi:hypothetical protein
LRGDLGLQRGFTDRWTCLPIGSLHSARTLPHSAAAFWGTPMLSDECQHRQQLGRAPAFAAPMISGTV